MIPGIVAQRWLHPAIIRPTRAINSSTAAYSVSGHMLERVNMTTANAFWSPVANSVKAILPVNVPFANTVLLIGANTSIVDESSKHHTLTSFGNVARTTSSQQFGAASILFDGIGDYIGIDQSTDFDFSSSPFTIELWVKPSNTNNGGILTVWSNAAGTADRLWAIYRQSNVFFFTWIDATGAQRILPANVNPTVGAWNYIAVSQSPISNSGVSTIRMRVNNTAPANFVISSDSNRIRSYSSAPNALPRIGTINGFSGFDFAGAMDEIRIIKGYDLYDTDETLTPPTSAFPRS